MIDFERVHAYIVARRGGTFAPRSLVPIEASYGFESGVRNQHDAGSQRCYPKSLFTPADLAAYYAAFSASAAGLGLHIGCWLYRDHYWLDLTRWLPDRIEAILTSISYLEEAVFDCAVAAGQAPAEKWRGAFHVLTGERRSILPHVIAELAEHGVAPVEARCRLAAAWARWGFQVARLGGRAAPPWLSQ